MFHLHWKLCFSLQFLTRGVLVLLIFLQNCRKRQILWRMCSVVFLDFRLKFPIQTLHSVTPTRSVFWRAMQFQENELCIGFGVVVGKCKWTLKLTLRLASNPLMTLNSWSSEAPTEAKHTTVTSKHTIKETRILLTTSAETLECDRFSEILQNFSERQILWSLYSVVFNAFVMHFILLSYFRIWIQPKIK